MAEKKSGSLKSTARTSTPEKTSDAVLEYKIFKDHYHGLTKLLFNTNLTPHLIQEGVIAPADQEQLSAISTSTGKAEMVLPKITSGLEAGLTESFYKMLEIMKSYGNRDAQQLSITIEHEIAVSKSDKEPIPAKTIDELSLEFSALVADVADILHKSPAILNKLKSVCYSITTTEKSLLFSEKESAAIRASHSVFDVFYELRGHWRWENPRLLFTIIKRSGSREALKKYEQFQNKKKYTEKLSKLASYFQSVQKSLPPGYTRMIAIIEKDYSDFTVKECEELDEYLADVFNSVALPPADYEKSHSIKVTWYIPTEAVSGVLSKAYQAKELFKLLSISYFEIDEVVIWNNKWLSLQVLTVQLSEKESLITGYCSKLSQAEAHLKEVTDEKDSLSKEVKMSLSEKLTLEQKCAGLQSALDKVEAEKLQMKPQAKAIKDDQTKAQKTESVHTIKMKYDGLQAKLREKDIYLKHLKDQLNESENKIAQLQKEQGSVKTSEPQEFDVVKSLEEKAKQVDDLQQALQKVQNENEILQKKMEKMQSPEDTSKLHLRNSELSTQVGNLSTEVMQLKGINSLLRVESDDLKVQIAKLQKKEQQLTEELDAVNNKLLKDLKDLEQTKQQLNESQSQLLSTKRQLEDMKQMQSQEDTSKLHLRNSELSTQVGNLSTEVMQLKGINSLLRVESDDLKVQIAKLQKKEQQVQLQEDTSKNSKLSLQVEELSTEVMQLKGINSQLRVEDDDLKAQIMKRLQKKEQQVQSQEDTSKLEFKNSELLSQVEELNTEVMQLKGINSLLRVESDDLKEQITKLQKKEQQVITQVPEAVSDSKAIIEELNDQVTSYLGLLNDSDDIIKKLQTENRQLKEENEQAKKHQVESKQLKEEAEQVIKRRVENEEEKEAKKWRRASMYAESTAGITAELQKKLQKRREFTDKDNQ